MNFWVPWK